MCKPDKPQEAAIKFQSASVGFELIEGDQR
jgi:hypothetical protein